MDYSTIRHKIEFLSLLRLSFLLGNNEEIVEVQVPSTGSGKSIRNLEPHVLKPAYDPTPVSGITLDWVQMHKFNAR